MTKRTALVLAVLILAFVASGCTATLSNTPQGYPCSNQGINNKGEGCFYFIKNGTAIACQNGTNDICDNTIGPFYDSLGPDTTLLCQDHYACANFTQVTTPVLCSAKFAYDNLANDGQEWQVVNRQEDQNTTGQSITLRFISTSATTISTTASIDLTANADAILGVIFVSVHAQLNASVSKTASTVVGNEVQVTIPPHQTAYGIYGVNVQVATGHLYQNNKCGGQANYGEVQTYVPIAPGWCVWISGETPCRVVSGS